MLQEELLETLNKIKTKLEKETANHTEAKQHVAELTAKFNELQQLVRKIVFMEKIDTSSISKI